LEFAEFDDCLGHVEVVVARNELALKKILIYWPNLEIFVVNYEDWVVLSGIDGIHFGVGVVLAGNTAKFFDDFQQCYSHFVFYKIRF
jgi:hypothetical protein